MITRDKIYSVRDKLITYKLTKIDFNNKRYFNVYYANLLQRNELRTIFVINARVNKFEIYVY